jgi:hypothetical protein
MDAIPGVVAEATFDSAALHRNRACAGSSKTSYGGPGLFLYRQPRKKWETICTQTRKNDQLFGRATESGKKMSGVGAFFR